MAKFIAGKILLSYLQKKYAHLPGHCTKHSKNENGCANYPGSSLSNEKIFQCIRDLVYCTKFGRQELTNAESHKEFLIN